MRFYRGRYLRLLPRSPSASVLLAVAIAGFWPSGPLFAQTRWNLESRLGVAVPVGELSRGRRVAGPSLGLGVGFRAGPHVSLRADGSFYRLSTGAVLDANFDASLWSYTAGVEFHLQSELQAAPSDDTKRPYSDPPWSGRFYLGVGGTSSNDLRETTYVTLAAAAGAVYRPSGSFGLALRLGLNTLLPTGREREIQVLLPIEAGLQFWP